MVGNRNSNVAATFTAFLLSSIFASHTLAVEPSCADPNLFGIISANTSYSGAVFVDQPVYIYGGATLTFEAGTHVTMCNASAAITVGKLSNTGGLVAIGTELAPIVFDALDPVTKWDKIVFSSDILTNSTLQHVILNDGGGNDPAAYNAPLYISDTKTTATAVPVIDHVTINDSGANGLVFLHNTGDPTAASISNISISGSAAAAIVGDAGAMGGLSGDNQFVNNNPDRIVVGASGNALITLSSIWRDHGIPYELTGGADVRTTLNRGWPCKWTLEPGVTLLVHPGKRLSIGSGDSFMEARGTEAKPVIITRLGDTEDNWEQLRLGGENNHTLEHVNFSWGGITTNPGDTYGMISKTGGGTVSMAHVRIEYSESSGMTVGGGNAYLRDSVVTNNPQAGLFLKVGGKGMTVRNSQIFNNLTGGVLNALSAAFCVDAMGNYWGDASGPAVTNTLGSACGNGNSNDSFGDSASRGVLYKPWADSVNGTASNRSQIKAVPAFVIADGLNSTEVTVTLRDLSGNPLVGKAVEIQSTVGEIQQPAFVSNVNGQVTAHITSPEPGFATISATNVTDDNQVAGYGGVTFWQGSGDTGGLIEPNGTPYAKPGLIIDRPPFIVGFPMEFSMPMQNTQANPLDVEVVYGVTGSNIGVPFAPVYTVQKTLAPGEQWDAPGVYVPDNTRHQCVQATLSFNSAVVAQTLRLAELQSDSQGSSTTRKNTDKNPCGKLNANNLIPTKGGLIGVGKHFYKAGNEARKVNNCLSSEISFGPSVQLIKTLATSVPGDYDQVFIPPVLTPPQVTIGGEITAGLAAAMNDLSDLAGELSALITANGVTRQRLQWAGQANDLAAVDLQYTTFRNYSLMEGQKLLEFASFTDVYLNEMALVGIEDPLMTPDQQAAYLETLKTTGFEQDTIDYIQDSGWGAEEVDLRLQQTITQYENISFVAIAFTDAVLAARDKAIADGNDLISRYGDQPSLPAGSQLSTGNSKGTAAATNIDNEVNLDAMSWEFDVGHASLVAETVTLLVKPLNLPINWSYELSDPVLFLEPGEIHKATLQLFPGPSSISTDTVTIAVEGYVLDELIGGIEFEYYVPSVIKPSDVIFTDGFE